MSSWLSSTWPRPPCPQMQSLGARYSRNSFPTLVSHTTWLPRPAGRETQPYLSMLMAQRFRMLAVHIMTSRVTKTSQQTRLKFQTPPVTWAAETGCQCFPPVTQSALLSSRGSPAHADVPSLWLAPLPPRAGRHCGTAGLLKMVTQERTNLLNFH